MWNLSSFHLETVSVSVKDRCTVCTKRTIDLEIVLMHRMVLRGDEAQVKARSIWDSANHDER
jgi:hypothetical protein